MYLPSRVHRNPATGRAVSVVMRRAELNGSAVCLTQMLRVPFQGFTKARYLPSGESWAPDISGSPNKSSRSIMGGRAIGGTGIRAPKLSDFVVSSQRHARFLNGRAHLGAGQRVQFPPAALLEPRASRLQFLGAEAGMAHEFSDTFG